MIELLNLQKQYATIEGELIDSFTNVLKSGQYILGPYVQQLELEIAKKIGVKEAIGVASGTDALILTLSAYNIGAGDEVITTPFTFIATAEAIAQVGATPIFVDIDPTTGLIDVSKIEQAITERTKAIIPVHIFGQPADMDEINHIATTHNLVVIEDACQAFGATYVNKYAGNLANAGCFSFFPTKNLGGIGDGGIITTNDQALAKKIRVLRVHGSAKKYFHDELGFNSRLDAVQAAIILVSLQHIDSWNKTRRDLASNYIEAIDKIEQIDAIIEKEDRKHVYHLFSIRSKQRNHIMQFLAESGIRTAVYYPCCLHLQPAFKYLGHQVGHFPNAEQLSNEIFSIPLHPFLTTKEQNVILHALRKSVKK
ncbi:dTDP-4-amino-4,6-dideoxygalactose transaminase [Amphibacillus marinus]|uniref:dTDP-4-amino-4,6-dideoxygalactose transaminase n=1 Tax=Amphibacillus marinus TaxID=872970 RepID=A0A1H8R9E7_9BACI|nr:DegT/DnrJ/EryC1/StrS family aminotransferase [Amphibacillus marinus]SEO62992.1 dTDP-4-amino-4,6-dideoxygalactose transaminase [Amphibacillus marinus]